MSYLLCKCAAIVAVLLCVLTSVACRVASDSFRSPAYAFFAMIASLSFALPPIGLVAGLFALRRPYRRKWVGAMLGLHFLALLVSFYYMEQILQ